MWSHSVCLLQILYSLKGACQTVLNVETPSHDSCCMMLCVLAGLWCSMWVRLSLDGPVSPCCLGIPFRLPTKDANLKQIKLIGNNLLILSGVVGLCNNQHSCPVWDQQSNNLKFFFIRNLVYVNVSKWSTWRFRLYNVFVFKLPC